ncbi:hypothetical protein [Sphingomonas sp. HDW15A]|uniref:hypothetical protein n=1 Tax=Sphingomonas sp. HDW15A TaxID=2714942 RepID=UPI001F10774D|nr:hypothetical protein [Sphingomonas sp. HDW15A]
MKRRVAAALGALSLAGCATAPAAKPVAVQAAPSVAVEPSAPAKAPEVPGGMQWLYGSAEGASASIQTYRAFERYVAAAVRNRPRDSVVLQGARTLPRRASSRAETSR